MSRFHPTKYPPLPLLSSLLQASGLHAPSPLNQEGRFKAASLEAAKWDIFFLKEPTSKKEISTELCAFYEILILHVKLAQK